jgi:hypothetical protein
LEALCEERPELPHRVLVCFSSFTASVLQKYSKAWVAFGCGSERTMIFVLLKDFPAWLPLLNKTDLEERFYWHASEEAEGGNAKWRNR